MGRTSLQELTENKKVLYIATKNEDYIRVSQETNLLKQYSSEFDAITSKHKSYFKRVIEVFMKLLRTNAKKYDVVYVSFMAQMIMPIFLFKFRKNTIIVDFFISIFDTLVDDRKKFSATSIVGKLLHLIDTQTIKSANLIITDTRAHSNYFSEEFKIPLEKFEVLYIEANTEFYHPMNISKPDNLMDKYVVVYFGSILPVQGVEVILETIKLLKEDDSIHFLMIGPIPEKYNKPIQDNVSYIDWLSQDKLAEHIAYADLCLAGHFSGTVGKAKRTIPGKAYIYKAMEKKVLFGDSPANRELFSEDDSNYFVSMGDSDDLKNMIVSIKEKAKCV